MTTPTQGPLPSADLLWKQYELHAELYQHYLELVLKFNVFYYAVTGGILSFYFSNTADVGMPRYGLLLFPALMSMGFGGLFLYAATLVKVVRKDMSDISRALGLLVFPEVRVLAVVLRISGILFLAVAVALATIIARAVGLG